MKWVNGGLGIAFAAIIFWTLAEWTSENIWFGREPWPTGVWFAIIAALVGGGYWIVMKIMLHMIFEEERIKRVADIRAREHAKQLAKDKEYMERRDHREA